jgi:hypothetical protein
MKTSLYKALMTEIQQAASAGPVADELNWEAESRVLWLLD